MKRWKPRNGESFFYVSRDGFVTMSPWEGYYNQYECGNCFSTSEQAEEAARRVRATLMEYQEELNK